MRKTLTEIYLDNLKELMDNVDRYYPLVKHTGVLAFSIAKYYPVLKKLSEE